MVARPVASLRHGAAAAPALLGEGPVWDPLRGELVWVDIERGLVHRRRPGEADVSLDLGQQLGCAVPRAAGGLALALRDGFALLPPDGGPARLVAPVEQQRSDTRMNDGACDSRGRFWAGTMSLGGDTRTAALYRLDPDLGVTRVLPGLSISNGLGWSPDDRLMYHVDTPRGRIDVYEFDLVSGAIGGRRAAIAVAAEQGRPDGLAVDAEGGIWVALWGGGAVQRYSLEGRAGPAHRATGEPGHELLLRRSRSRDALHHKRRPRSRARAARRIAVLLPARRPRASRHAVRWIAVAALQGRRVLVTGAGVGIGQAIARELALQGAAVCIHTSATAPDETLALIRAAGADAVAVRGDLARTGRPAARCGRRRRCARRRSTVW